MEVVLGSGGREASPYKVSARGTVEKLMN